MSLESYWLKNSLLGLKRHNLQTSRLQKFGNLLNTEN